MSKETPRMQLGKGIRALITNIEERGTAPTGDELATLSRETIEIPIDAIETNPYQPRQDFDEEALEEEVRNLHELVMALREGLGSPSLLTRGRQLIVHAGFEELYETL